ncbi:hypothetical protein B0J13DRAFT_465464 [Dactylonectria estremocensis]|uniref:Zn(2)-C6 fungal-type domain-containing protein n=1 Tax=Dactylonectria estremocensis TaxID=1079267 RepID=A0A9P9JFB2_9HYPO|nr:hypothetical protein B0J13DRAFT_465464 [Dactylonectria estremocensis]
MDLEQAKRPKAKFSRTKSGCRTCRIRRVKCDEMHPVCSQCTNTGRTCDGYGIWDRGVAKPGPPPLSNSWQIITSSWARGDKLESSCMDWYITRANKKIPGIFKSHIWNTLIIQASANDPTVWHSVVALASAHKREMLLCNSVPSSALSDESERFTLRQYNTAISHVRRHLALGDDESTKVAAMTCLIFICLEFLRGNYKTGNTHLQHGLSLLVKLRPLPDAEVETLVLKSHPDSIGDHLTEAFARLYVQSAFFGHSSHHFVIAVQDYPFGCPEWCIFSGPGAARLHLDVLLNRVHRLGERCREEQGASHDARDLELLNEQQRVRAHLRSWYESFKTSRAIWAAENKNSDQTFLAGKLLLIYHTMAVIMADSLLSASESAYDVYTPTFNAIVLQSIHLWNAAAPTIVADTLSGYCTTKFSFSADMGLILPLYYTSLKCRSPVIRRCALKLLLDASHQEGIWNGRLAAGIGQRVMQIEERGMHEQSIFERRLLDRTPGQWDEPLPIVPEACRIRHVCVELFDSPASALTLTYERMLDDRTWIAVQDECRIPGE